MEGRRIRRFGKAIALAESHGESIGIERIAASASEKLFDALDARIAAGVTNLYYEDVYSEMISRGELEAEAADVSGLRWTEIDTFEDLEASAPAIYALRCVNRDAAVATADRWVLMYG